MYLWAEPANNQISRIYGLMALEKLECLNLSLNRIERIENLYYLTALGSLYLSKDGQNRRQ